VEEKARLIEVSDSDDEEIDAAAATAGGGLGAPSVVRAEGGAAAHREVHAQEVMEAIQASLRSNFVFKGIPEDLLHEVCVGGVCGVCGVCVCDLGGDVGCVYAWSDLGSVVSASMRPLSAKLHPPGR